MKKEKRLLFYEEGGGSFTSMKKEKSLLFYEEGEEAWIMAMELGYGA